MMIKPYFAKSLDLTGKGSFKPYLCSRDIQVGDKFFGLTEQVCIKIEMGSGENYYPKEMLVWFEDDGVQYWRPLRQCFKVIGEISPEAIWVKEGDEFDEYSEYYIGNGPDLPSIAYCQIKCPTCKTFH